MAWYTPLQNALDSIVGNPGKSMFVAGVLASVVTYNIGSYKGSRAAKDGLEGVELVEDVNKDGYSPDVSINFLDGEKKPAFMQSDGHTLLTPKGIKGKFNGFEARFYLPRNQHEKPRSENPLDKPYVIKQTELNSADRPAEAKPAEKPEAKPADKPEAPEIYPVPSQDIPLVPTMPFNPQPPESAPVKPADGPVLRSASYDIPQQQTYTTSISTVSESENTKKPARLEEITSNSGWVPSKR